MRGTIGGPPWPYRHPSPQALLELEEGLRSSPEHRQGDLHLVKIDHGTGGATRPTALLRHPQAFSGRRNSRHQPAQAPALRTPIMIIFFFLPAPSGAAPSSPSGASVFFCFFAMPPKSRDRFCAAGCPLVLESTVAVMVNKGFRTGPYRQVCRSVFAPREASRERETL